MVNKAVFVLVSYSHDYYEFTDIVSASTDKNELVSLAKSNGGNKLISEKDYREACKDYGEPCAQVILEYNNLVHVLPRRI